MISRAKMRKRNDKKTVESKEDGQRKVLQKSFTKKKKKIGLPVQFEDSKTRVDAQVRFKSGVAKGLCFIGNVILEYVESLDWSPDNHFIHSDLEDRK